MVTILIKEPSFIVLIAGMLRMRKSELTAYI
jgi:hypothetical protein